MPNSMSSRPRERSSVTIGGLVMACYLRRGSDSVSACSRGCLSLLPLDAQTHPVETRLRAAEPERLVELGQVPASEQGHQHPPRGGPANDGQEGFDDPRADLPALPLGTDHDVLQVSERGSVAKHQTGADDEVALDGHDTESGAG